jgi:5-deoxy-glucuronate isomerase
MKSYDRHSLLVHPGKSADSKVIVDVTPEQAGWETIHFQSLHLETGQQWSFDCRMHELALVVLGGHIDVRSNHGAWLELGERRDVFSGLPYALYMPPQSSLSVSARTECEFAAGWVASEADYPARLITPEDIEVEIRGGDHATRQINRILPPGFPCGRLVVVEVYTPGGNWSSYPPHKHDIHKPGPDENILEADLDEIYYYKIDRLEGYALQRIYTDPESPLHRAGYGIDETVQVRNNDVVLIPEGYHPVSSPPGYTTYYLNYLAGSAQSLAATDDPDFAWVKDTYQQQDPRLPIYPINRNPAR